MSKDAHTDHTGNRMKMMRLVLLSVAMLALAQPIQARQGDTPYSIGSAAKRGIMVPEVYLPAIDPAALRNAHDVEVRDATHARTKRLAIAEGNPVALGPDTDGIWQTMEDGSSLWLLRVQVPGATDLHLSFDRYSLPPGAALWVIGADDYYEGPYTSDDASPLSIPMVPGDAATIELRLPEGMQIGSEDLILTDVGAGFRSMFDAIPRLGIPGNSGACNVNVACPLGQPYTAEQRAITYYEFRADSDGLTYVCTATLMSDVPADRKNYVLTAAHCLATPAEAASMRMYWNFRSTTCSGNNGISFTQNQTGATLRATRADADFTLVELNQNPDPSWNLFHAGWDATNIAPSGSIGIHHPSQDSLKINNSPVAPRTRNNCIGTGGASSNTHWHTGPYDQGTTEGGSSGSGLWIPSSAAGGNGRRLIGVLSGGVAACVGTVPDNGWDCYGKFSAAWDGPSPESRLRDWLDPTGTGTQSIAGIDHNAPPPSLPVDGSLAVRIAAGLQARPLRLLGRGIGSHPRPTNTNTSSSLREH
ncbi:trypsin-like serine peptidase [Dokdonella sp.]|uniref:trypsin-like serine peptidase n=1 Tax=Dokdonella sp. TaxID=2291710 RepID=UPI003C545514